MSFNVKLTNAIDSFIPDRLLADREMRTRARMFMLSHLFGPILGNVIPGYLFWVDPKSMGTLAVLSASITSFWLYPFFLKYFGNYRFLSFASIQNLLFAILWGCYFYGGLSSPFLPWLVTVPLLAFFYTGASVRNCVIIMIQIGLSIAAFVTLFAMGGALPHTIPLSDMQGIGIISIISASIYVSMMALYYAGILRSQSEFEREVKKHLQTADQLREAASEAARAGAAKAEFLAKMSHELRTPLNAVIGYSEMLLEDTDPDRDAQGVDDLNKINTAGHHLLSLVNSILDLSKIEAGKMEVFPEPLEVGSLVTKVATRWGRDKRRAGKEIRAEVSGSLGIVNVDGGKLEQVLDVILENAVQYASHAEISVIARAAQAGRDPDNIELIVRDTGPGIPSELLPTLFETFNDFDDLSASKYGGAGLGLPLCHRLCGLMKAKILVSTHRGLGTTITIVVPRHFVEPEDVAPSDPLFAQAA